MLDDVKNYYELLELSQNANHETIERMFRYLAAKWHPDAGGDKERFSLLVTAFETLKDPASRTAYDISLKQQQEKDSNLVAHASQAGPDTVDRHKLLCLFYAARRQGGKRPSLGTVTVESMMNCPAEVLEFHLWYFREKGWIQRADNGGFVITAEGVDQVESGEVALATRHLRIEEQAPNGAAALTSGASASTALATTVA